MLKLNQLARLIQPQSKHLGGQGSAIQFTEIDNQRPITVLNVSTGALAVATMIQLAKLIL